MERYYWSALKTTPGISNSRLRSLVAFFGSARQAWQANRRDLFLCGCLEDSACNNLLTQREKIDIPQIAAAFDKKGIKICIRDDADYPQLLTRIYSPPPILYYRGRLPSDQMLIAIVGARKASAYGKSVATMLAGGLAASGIGVVSGAARGIDTAAHIGSLQNNGYTIAVLGCGVDVAYPAENAKMLSAIAEKGAVISEYAPGTKPLAGYFPARNRIISGLSRGVVVVEAAEKSGALITADYALEDGRDVFAVPGSIFSDSSKGTHRLIKQGAKLVENTVDILEEYGLEKVASCVKPAAPAFDEDERAVFDVLSFENPLTLEEIILKVNLPPQVVTYILIQLELRGLAAQYGGQRFVRVPGREAVE